MKEMIKLRYCAFILTFIFLFTSCGNKDSQPATDNPATDQQYSSELIKKKNHLIEQYDLEAYLKDFDFGTDKEYDPMVLQYGNFVRTKAVLTDYVNGDAVKTYRVYTGYEIRSTDEGSEVIYDDYNDYENPALEKHTQLPPVKSVSGVGTNIYSSYFVMNQGRTLQKAEISVAGAERSLFDADSVLAENIKKLYAKYDLDYNEATLCFYRLFNYSFNAAGNYYDSRYYDSVIDYEPGVFVREKTVKGEKVQVIQSFPVAKTKHVYQYDLEGRAVAMDNYTAILPTSLKPAEDSYVYETPTDKLQEFEEQKNSVGASQEEDFLREFLSYSFEYEWEKTSVNKFEYDADGRITKDSCYNNGGVLLAEKSYEYDENGRLVKEEIMEDDKTRVLCYEYEYDDLGNLITEKCNDEAGLPVFEYRYFYTFKASDSGVTSDLKKRGMIKDRQ